MQKFLLWICKTYRIIEKSEVIMLRDEWDLKISSPFERERLDAIKVVENYIPSLEQFKLGLADKNNDVATFFVACTKHQLTSEDIKGILARDNYSMISALVGRKDFTPTQGMAGEIMNDWPIFKHEITAKLRMNSFEPSGRCSVDEVRCSSVRSPKIG
jgi:hypothetical protein